MSNENNETQIQNQVINNEQIVKKLSAKILAKFEGMRHTPAGTYSMDQMFDALNNAYNSQYVIGETIEEKISHAITIIADQLGTSWDDVIPIYKSEDDIPVYNDETIKPLDIETLGLPEHNTVMKMIRYMTTESDTYPEYALQASLCAICTIAQRRIYSKINGREIYTNLWFGNTGPSGYSRKTYAMNRSKRFVKKACGNLYLPQDVNPESLLEAMATRILEKQKTKEGVEWKEVTLLTPDNVIRSQRTFMKDEVGQLFSQMEKSTHKHFKDTLLSLHGCETYEKELVSKKIFITDPYICMYWSTTIDTLTQHMTRADIRSGWLARTLTTTADYEKPRKAMREDDDDEETPESLVIIDELRDINAILTRSFMDKPIRARFQPKALELIDEWVAERELYYIRKHDTTTGACIARFQENAVRLAIVIELGNLPYLTKNNNKAMIKEFKISKNAVEIALHLIDAVFFPHTKKLIAKLRDDLSGTHQSGISNDIVRVEEKLMEQQKMPRRDAYRQCRMKENQFNECADSLKAAGALEFAYVKTKQNKLIPWIVHVPAELRDEKFKHNYAKVDFTEYICGIVLESLNPELHKQEEENETYMVEKNSNFELSQSQLCEPIAASED